MVWLAKIAWSRLTFRLSVGSQGRSTPDPCFGDDRPGVDLFIFRERRGAPSYPSRRTI